MDLTLVGPAEVQQLLQFGAVRGLRALAFLPEPLDDFVSLAPAVLLAGAQLRRQAQVLSLLLRAHANVDDGANHWSQLNAIGRVRQGDRYAAHFALLLRCALLQKGLDDDMRYDVGMSPDLIDFHVRDTIGIGSE